MQQWARLILAALMWLAPTLAWAHKPSDSYVSLSFIGSAFEGRWDIALRDLDFVLTLDANNDGAITWGEVRAKRGVIEAYALSRMSIAAGSQPCPLEVTDFKIDHHSDGAYAVLLLRGSCSRVPEALTLDYRLFAEVDPQHKGLVQLTAGDVVHTLVLGVGRPSQTLARSGWGLMQQAGDFILTGVFHIWTGYDHILFLVSLLLPAVVTREGAQWVARGSFRAAALEVLKVVSAFTLAHSVTLSLATLGVVQIPARVSESAIAFSVIVAALNNLYPVMERRIWIAAFCFGLVHGFGFANALSELGLPPATLLLALISFNFGVELGQIAIVVAFLPLAWAMRTTPAYRLGVLSGGSGVIAVIACLWLMERALNVNILF